MSRQAAQTTIETPLAWACLAYAAAAVALFPGTYVALGTPYAATLVRTLPPMLLFGLAVAAMVARPAAPFAFIRELWGRRCRGAAGTVVVFFIGMTAFSTFKHHLPPMAGFYADPWLADLDEALHGGPAWARAHAVAPDGAGAVLFWLYGPVWFAQWFGFVLFAAFLPRDRLRARYLLSFAATLFVLGTLTAAAAASGGPILYDRIAGSERFAALLASLGADPYGGAMLRASDYLFASYLSGCRRLRQRHLGDAEHPRRRRDPERAAAGLPRPPARPRRARLCRRDPVRLGLFRLALCARRLRLDRGRACDLGRRRPPDRPARAGSQGRDVRSGLTPPAFGAYSALVTGGEHR